MDDRWRRLTSACLILVVFGEACSSRMRVDPDPIATAEAGKEPDCTDSSSLPGNDLFLGGLWAAGAAAVFVKSQEKECYDGDKDCVHHTPWQLSAALLVPAIFHLLFAFYGFGNVEKCRKEKAQFRSRLAEKMA